MLTEKVIDNLGNSDQPLVCKSGVGAPKAMTRAISRKIKLFGRPELPELPEKTVFPAKGFQLVAYLSLAEGFRASRKKIANLLWDADSDDLALNSLRQLLARVRRLMPAGSPFDTDGRYIVLVGSYRKSDLCGFTADCISQRGTELAMPLELFTGELLEGIEDTASEAFAEWLQQERTSLREKYLFGASSYLFSLSRFGRADRATIDQIAARMLALDPEREETYRTLIQIYGRTGRLEKARRTYHDLLEMLRTEHGAKADPDTERVARSVFASAKKTELPVAPQQTTEQPRVALMMPEWLLDKSGTGIFRALIGSVAAELSRYRTFQILGPHTSLKVDHDFGTPIDNSVLRADYSVSGFARQEDGQPVLFLRLARCDTRQVVWSSEFPFTQLELINLHRQLTRRVVVSLASALERDRISELGSTEKPGAYAAYLSGVEAMMVCNLPDLRRARKRFSNAIDMDRHFAGAHAAMARCLLYEWLILGANTPEIVTSARRCATRAFEIDPNDGLIVSTIASIDMYQHDVDAALVRYSEAEVMCPNSSELLVGYANALSTGGQPSLGLGKFERAISLDPIPPDDHWWAGASIAFDDHQYHRAIGYCCMMKNEDAALRILAACHALVGNTVKASEYGARLREIYPDQSAIDMVGITPIQDQEVYQRFLEGLRLAGLD